eukprot:CAMPEP_0202903916 /NCGR_PEP_ID=MMETSP1392-20130828/27131_1 /ASSEMBLY_ACC=CAM_ASM_000868 /TAXON_ID=225041 /ORGANISM="Chlamydomonas chlamydogama, Strain SAG 11-48b" /LENGTH=53 /DNA_ID=CAMNT_0049591297 /DNA_START=106 /DNA_END=267 /DNA_ORIENTATION=-
MQGCDGGYYAGTVTASTLSSLPQWGMVCCPWTSVVWDAAQGGSEVWDADQQGV